MRFRLYPTPAQEAVLARHCSDARLVWNIALEQRRICTVRHQLHPSRYEQCRQLTEARASESSLADGSAMVQQGAIHDLDLAFRWFFSGTHGYPQWRKRDQDEGFRVTRLAEFPPQRLSRHIGVVHIPKA